MVNLSWSRLLRNWDMMVNLSWTRLLKELSHDGKPKMDNIT